MADGKKCSCTLCIVLAIFSLPAVVGFLKDDPLLTVDPKVVVSGENVSIVCQINAAPLMRLFVQCGDMKKETLNIDSWWKNISVKLDIIASASLHRTTCHCHVYDVMVHLKEVEKQLFVIQDPPSLLADPTLPVPGESISINCSVCSPPGSILTLSCDGRNKSISLSHSQPEQHCTVNLNLTVSDNHHHLLKCSCYILDENRKIVMWTQKELMAHDRPSIRTEPALPVPGESVSITCSVFSPPGSILTMSCDGRSKLSNLSHSQSWNNSTVSLNITLSAARQQMLKCSCYLLDENSKMIAHAEKEIKVKGTSGDFSLGLCITAAFSGFLFLVAMVVWFVWRKCKASKANDTNPQRNNENIYMNTQSAHCVSRSLKCRNEQLLPCNIESDGDYCSLKLRQGNVYNTLRPIHHSRQQNHNSLLSSQH
uniref:uncharacterized protein n=1 Tax=Myxine glutinosa TaxID=7769 RepID=UPI00358FDF2B